LINRGGKHFDKNDFETEKKYLYNQAVEITESILLIKQHSVNCISASIFYLITQVDYFTYEVAESFIVDLFKYEQHEIENLDEIKDYIKQMYSSFLEEYSSLDHLTVNDVILNHLKKYKNDVL